MPAGHRIRGGIWQPPDPIHQVKVGTWICVLTSESRFSLLHVKRIDDNLNLIVLDVKTYKKAGD
jgi:hypothetical protein